MRKKQYEQLAIAIREHKNGFVDYHSNEGQVNDIVEFIAGIYATPFINALCDILKAENPKFDENKFRGLLNSGIS